MGGDDKKSGCGLINAVFRRRSLWPRRSSSTGAIQAPYPSHVTRHASTPEKARKCDFEGPAFGPRNHKDHKGKEARRVPHSKSPPVHQQQQGRRGPGISGELESMIVDYQKSRGPENLVRASSSNVMLYGNLGNLRQPGNSNNYGNGHRSSNNDPRSANGKYSTSMMGNEEPEKPVSLCRALSTRMDPEQLKILGNEDYRNGRFAEALALYDAAISINPNKASYRSNKSAALVGLREASGSRFRMPGSYSDRPLLPTGP